MSELTVTIPGTPHAGLSPNSRVDWHVKARLTRDARGLAKYSALEQHGRIRPLRAPVMLHAVIAWESRRKIVDITNGIASLKSFEDGLVDAGIMGDDRGVVGWTLKQIRDPRKRGYTVITILEEKS